MSRSHPSRHALTVFGIASLLLGPSALRAQTAQLLDDVSTIRELGYGAPLPKLMGASGSHIFFAITSPSDGALVWASDGTPENTIPIDLRCSSGSCRTTPAWVGASSARAFFAARDNLSNALEYFASDGTPAGTLRLPAPLGYQFVADFDDPDPFSTIFDDRLFLFLQLGGTDRYFLVSTDGTPEGFTSIREMSRPIACASLQSHVLVIERGSYELRVWRTDGTPAGSTPAVSIPDHLDAYDVTAARSVAYFLGQSSTEIELWRTDGTVAGTFPVSDFTYDTPNVGTIHTLEDVAAVIVRDGEGGEVFVSDGTIEGSRFATDFTYDFALDTFEEVPLIALIPGKALAIVRGDPHGGGGTQTLYSIPLAGGHPSVLHEVCGVGCSRAAWVSSVGRTAIFASDGSNGFEPWVTDGTIAGTLELQDICPGSCSSDPYLIVGDGERLLFGAVQEDRTIWFTDGTPLGTTNLNDPLTGDPGGSSSMHARNWSQIGARVAFPAYHGAFEGGIWLTDLSAGSASFLKNFATPGAPVNRTHIAGSDSRAVFIARESAGSGPRLWFASSESVGASEIPGDYLASETGTSAPDQLFDIDSRVVYVSAFSDALFGIDEAGTAELIAPLQSTHLLGNPARLDDLVFLASDSENVDVWTTDGTAQGTALRHSYGTELGLFAGPFAVNEKVLAFRYSPSGIELSAFSPDFHSMVPLVTLTSEADQPSQIAPAGGELAFFTDHVYGLTELWRTDGSPSGTVRLFERSSRESLMGAVHHDGSYYLLVGSTEGNGRLWRSDGTAEGTEIAAELTPGFPERSLPILSIDGRIVFLYNSDERVELWASDGTQSGTEPLVEVRGSGSGTWADFLAAVPGGAVFAGHDLEHGTELWFTDGTAAGTRRLHDIMPGHGSSWPRGFHLSGDSVYFFADDGLHGSEPWILDLSGGADCSAGEHSICLEGGRFRAEARWRSFDGAEGDANAIPLTDETGHFWFFDESNVELILKVVDGRGYNGHHWVFYGALTNVEYTITVTDTETGATKRYFNPAGRFASTGDIQAFGPLGAAASPSVSTEPTHRSSPRSDTAAAGGNLPLGTCAPSSTRFCILEGRFAVEAHWEDFAGDSGVAYAATLTDDTGYFYFFDPENVEVVLKAIDGGGLNDHFWIFYGALSNVEYTITVTDTVARTSRVYRNPLGSFGSFGDIEAFPAD